MSLSTERTVTEKRSEHEIAGLAASTLQSLTMWKLPVNPLRIASEEGIELQPGTYSEKFDGRIRYIPEVSTFALAFRDFEAVRNRGRVHFTIAHELEHYYLHRDYLLRGECHSSVSNFRSHEAMEQEADAFAANLLMPKALFEEEVRSRAGKVCDLADICKLANEKLQTSLTSTARRYCQADIEACSVVLCKDGVIQWAIHSEDMKRIGMRYIEFGRPIPSESITARLRSRGGIEKGVVTSDVWYETRRPRDLWEECMRLGYTGTTLTLLTLENSM